MPQKRHIGSILLESGRVTDSDIERALEYQRLHGGFFGQALIDLGLVTREEIDWALASQFDIPYIFPRPDMVDPTAAALVGGDWALAHLAVPILKAGHHLTVVCADPLQQAAFDDLRARTGLELELALASPGRIRELITEVFGDDDAAADERAPIEFGQFIACAVEKGAEQFGISIRGGAAWAWLAGDAAGQRPLAEGWETELAQALRPAPAERLVAGEPVVSWKATLGSGGEARAVEARALQGAGGTELVFRPLFTGGPPSARNLPLPRAIAAELRLLARTGRARVAVASPDPELARAVLPYLPGLVRSDGVRSVHLAERGEPAGVYTLRPAPDVLSALPAFRFDALTCDLAPSDYPVADILGAAPLAFAYLAEEDWRRRLSRLGIGWVLTASRGEHGEVTWDLQAAEG